MKKLLGILVLGLLLLIQPSFGDHEELHYLLKLLDKKKDLSGEEFYNELSKFQDERKRALKGTLQKQKSEQKAVEEYRMQEDALMQMKAGLSYSLDFRCLNDCKLFKPYDQCKRICMVPTVLIDNSDRGW